MKYLDLTIKILIIILFAFGNWLVFGRHISMTIKEMINRKKLIRSIRQNKITKTDNSVVKHINMMLNVLTKREIEHEGVIFIAASLLIFCVSFILLIQIQSFKISIISSIAISIVPYIVIRINMKNTRIKGSYDGVNLVIDILNNYRQNYFNIMEAIDHTIPMENITPFTKRILTKLSLKLRAYKDEKELDEIIKEFVFAYDTEWSILLGQNIKIAVLEGTDVSPSLNDILIELKNAGDIIEANKRFNNDSFNIIKYMLIPLYFFTIYLCHSTFGFSMKKYINYQFLNPLGLRFALIMFGSIIVCFVILMLNRRPKYDI